MDSLRLPKVTLDEVSLDAASLPFFERTYVKFIKHEGHFVCADGSHFILADGSYFTMVSDENLLTDSNDNILVDINSNYLMCN